MVYSCAFRDDHFLESPKEVDLLPQVGDHADIQEEVDHVDLAVAVAEDANEEPVRPLEGLASWKAEQVRDSCHCDGLELDCCVFHPESVDEKALAYLGEEEVHGDLGELVLHEVDHSYPLDQKALACLGEVA